MSVYVEKNVSIYFGDVKDAEIWEALKKVKDWRLYFHIKKDVIVHYLRHILERVIIKEDNKVILQMFTFFTAHKQI